MKKALIGSAAALLALTGYASADGGGCACPIPSITLYTQPQPPPAKPGPTVPLAAPALYPATVAPPKWTQAPPSHPVTLYEVPPPPIRTYAFTPRPVPLCHAEVHPPHWTEAPARQPITVFASSPLPVKQAPPTTIPPITFVNTPQPACPAHLGNVGGHCATGGQVEGVVHP